MTQGGHCRLRSRYGERPHRPARMIVRLLACLLPVGVVLLPGCGERARPQVSDRMSVSATPSAEGRGQNEPSSTAAPAPRNLRCEVSSCDYARETCCESGPDRVMSGCQKKVTASETAERGQRCSEQFAADYIGIDCLDTKDCPSGLTCCAVGDQITHCATSCMEHEACSLHRADACHAGSRCEASDTRSGGICLVASPSVRCGAERCGGTTAGCRYDWSKQRGDCVALGAGGAWPESVFATLTSSTALLQCTSPKDCGGERCCAGGPMPMTECSGECTSGIDVCDTVRDCPVFVGPPVGCKADAEGPPFLKTCRYAAQ
jgi:hypothetical protein